MKKSIIFDMDGTIADLYGVTNWLEGLMAEDPSPYQKAKPLYDPDSLNALLKDLKYRGWRIIVTTWLSKNSSPRYDALVREAKIAWLDKYNFPYDEIHIVKYGTPKTACTKYHGGIQILVDDNEEVRKEWTLGKTIDAHNNIIEELLKLF